MNRRRVLALVPAHDEEHTIGATVSALMGVDAIDDVLVVDDGSDDQTSERALGAGASVLKAPGRLGKGGAVEAALARCAPADVYVFADGDLGESAAGIERVLRAVLDGRADLVIAVLGPQGGGFGVIKRFARSAIDRLSGFRPREPLSGQRAITHDGLASCRPLAGGFGMETAMTIDAMRAGLRVLEVDADLHHDAPGRDIAGFVHRGRQGWDILMAVVARALRR